MRLFLVGIIPDIGPAGRALLIVGDRAGAGFRIRRRVQAF